MRTTDTENDRSQSSVALATRHQFNQSRGERDLIQWMAPGLDVRAGSRWLDLGCGRGDLLARLGPLVGPSGRLAGVDVSEESLGVLRRRAAALDLPLEAHCLDMDDLLDPYVLPELTELTHVTAVYALYYAEDPGALLRAMHARLAEDGRIAVVGPAPGNNREWFELLEEAGAAPSERIVRVSEEFMPERVVPTMEALGGSFQKRSTTNRVTFLTARELISYWRSNVYHDLARDGDVVEAIEDRFEHRASFTITKRIAMVTMEVPRRA